MTSTHSSSERSRPFLKGHVIIRSEDAIETLSERLSSALLKGVPFGGKDDGIYEEVPAMYVDVAGLRFVLSGYAGEHYVLECFPSPNLPPFGGRVFDVDISDHLYRALGGIENASIECE